MIRLTYITCTAAVVWVVVPYSVQYLVGHKGPAGIAIIINHLISMQTAEESSA